MQIALIVIFAVILVAVIAIRMKQGKK